MPKSPEQDLQIKLEQKKREAIAQFTEDSELGTQMKEWKERFREEQIKIITDCKGYLPKGVKDIQRFHAAYKFLLKNEENLNFYLSPSKNNERLEYYLTSINYDLSNMSYEGFCEVVLSDYYHYAVLIAQADGIFSKMGAIPEKTARISVSAHPGYKNSQLVYARFNGFNPVTDSISHNGDVSYLMRQFTSKDKPVGTIHIPQAGCSIESVKEYLSRYGSSVFDISIENIYEHLQIVNNESNRWDGDNRDHINLEGSERYLKSYMVLLAIGYYSNFSIIGFNY